MFCPKCGNTLNEDGVCPACAANEEPVIIEEEVPALPEKDPGKTLGTVSLILGIVSLVLGTCCSCLAACLGGAPFAIAAVVGIILGVMAMKKSQEAGFEKNKMALIGMILSIVAVVIIIVFIAFNGVIGGLMGMEQATSYNDFYGNYYY